MTTTPSPRQVPDAETLRRRIADLLPHASPTALSAAHAVLRELQGDTPPRPTLTDEEADARIERSLEDIDRGRVYSEAEAFELVAARLAS